MLNELRLINHSNDNKLKEYDIIVVFKGDVYIIDMNDLTNNNIQGVLSLLKKLCETYYGMRDTIFDKDGGLRDIFTNHNYRNIFEALFNFENMPKLIVGLLLNNHNDYKLVINNNYYDVYNSKELYDLLRLPPFNGRITSLIINGRNTNIPSNKPADIPVAKLMYHGTTTKYLESILKKGIRNIKDNSIFNVNNQGYVFLTSDYTIAEDYAENYSQEIGGNMAVLEIDTDLIDKDKIVLDYDFEDSFVDNNEISVYTQEPIFDRGYAFSEKGNIATTNGRYGSKFSKIGYKGIIMPSAIKHCYIYDSNNDVKQYTREEILMNLYRQKNENINHTINEVSSSELNLNSFNVRNVLNKRFWIMDGKTKEYKLSSKVRLRLLDIADDFIKELSVSWVKPIDIQFTGSLANYNWSRYSDVDIHIIYDFKKIYKKSDFVDDYFKAKKEMWLKNHNKLKIYGFPIEISIEDANERNPSSGKYSLESNKWIKEPSDFQDAKLNAKYIKDYSAKVMTEIDKIEKQIDNETDRHKIEVLGNKIENIFSRLKNLRAEGLKSSQKEMSSGNIIYKLIRRMKYIDKIWNIANKAYDKANSITENKKIF